MSVFGGYGPGGDRDLPRVLRFSIRPDGSGPRGGTHFACSFIEEGTGIRWEYPATLSRAAEQKLVADARTLGGWSVGRGSASAAQNAVDGLGRQLRRSFVAGRGEEYLGRMTPTALLVDVDETILNLPWELMHGADGPFVTQVPVGRVVATRTAPRAERDPLTQDREVRILAVADPTADLAMARRELRALRDVVGRHPGGYSVHLDELEGGDATAARFRERLAATDYDILHFAGHAGYAPRRPGRSALHFADGAIRAQEIGSLPWPSPPGLVFASACESAMAARGAPLVGRRRTPNGLAAAFLSAGVAGYIGYLWPVTEGGAEAVAGTFYETLFERENVGLGVLDARRRVESAWRDAHDLTAYSLVLYGDAAGEHRRNLATAA